MTAVEGLAYALAGLAWAALLYRAPALVRGRRSGTRRALWTTLLGVTAAVTVRLPHLRDEVDRLAGVANLSQLFENGFILVGIWGVQELLVHLDRPPVAEAKGVPGGVRGLRAVPVHTWLLVAVLTTMTVLFALAPVHEPAEDFWVRYADAPLILAYRLTYLAYLSVGLLAVVRRCTRYARLTGRPAVALGLRLCAVGGAIGLAYAGHEAAYALLRRAGAAYPLEGLVDPGRLRNVLIVAALAPLLVGSTLPAWGERVGLGAALVALGRWADAYRAYRRLYPLWRDLVRATPEVALEAPPPPVLDALTWRDLRLRLYRRVIEIWDGRLALRPYLDAAVADGARRACRASGVEAAEELYVVEAAALAAGVRAKTDRRSAAEPAALPLDRHAEETGATGEKTSIGASLEGDVDVLGRLARCYRTSPIVRAAAARAVRGVPTPPGAGGA